jgi:hypothetical protein
MLNHSRIKPCAGELVSRAAKIAAMGLVALCLAACPPEPSKDISIGEITIFNIPREIGAKDTFRVYLNASDSESENDPPAARGWADAETPSGKHMVTIPLQTPVDASTNPNPTSDTAPWAGTATFFSVMISPASVSGPNDIAVRAGTPLDKSKARMNWEELLQMSINDAFYSAKVQALYDGLIAYDDDIQKTP